MGVEEFSQTVRGTGGTLSTNTTGTVETDNYGFGDAFSLSGGNLPVTVDPTDRHIQELNITTSGSDTTAEITTTGGDTFVLELHGATASFDKWEIESVTFDGTADVSGGWAGE